MAKKGNRIKFCPGVCLVSEFQDKTSTLYECFWFQIISMIPFNSSSKTSKTNPLN